MEALKVAEAFVNEDDYTVWSNLLSNLSSVSTILQYSDVHDQYKAFILRLCTKTARELGWDKVEGEGMIRKLFYVSFFWLSTLSHMFCSMLYDFIKSRQLNQFQIIYPFRDGQFLGFLEILKWTIHNVSKNGNS